MPVQTLNKSAYTLIINSDFSDFANKLNELGYKTHLLSSNVCLASPVCKHPDMQFITLKQETFVLPESTSFIKFLSLNNINFELTEKAEENYPKDVLCNGKLIGNKFFCNTKTIDKKIMESAQRSGLEIIHVNQGYTGCSTLKVNDNAIITSDTSIYEAAIKNKIEALLITEGFIKLTGYNHGFIGGCSGNINNELIIFCGSLENHPDKNKIRNFYQTSEDGSWMEKRGYECMYLALMDESKTIHAATLIIYKSVF